jgi:hypothetical protein
MSLEQLLFVALFVLIPLFNFLAGLLRKRMQRRAESEGAPPTPVVVPLPTPVTELPWAALPEAVPRERPAAPPPRPVSPPSARPHARRSEARRGIVWMTILGPCPGLERPGEPRSSGVAAGSPTAR